MLMAEGVTCSRPHPVTLQAMQITESLPRYAEYRRSQGYAENTVRIGSGVLTAFVRIVGDMQMTSLNPSHVDKWLAIRSGQVKPATINTEAAQLREWEKWAHRCGYLSPRQNLAGHVRKQRVVPRSRVIVPPSRFGELLDCASRPTDRIVVATGLYTLMRQGEITSLRVAHVDLDTGSIHAAIHKSAKRDTVPVCAELDAEIRRYWTWRSQQTPLGPSQFFICSSHNRFAEGEGRLHRQELRPDRCLTHPWDAVKRTLSRMGYDLEPGEGVHTLRRSGATALYRSLREQGHDYAIRVVQAMLHHTSVTTTERYLDLDADKKTRDDLIRGQSMYGVEASNVTPIGRRSASGS